VVSPIQKTPAHLPANYKIMIAGSLDTSWEVWFDGLVIEQRVDPDGTIQTCLHLQAADQPRLRSVLTRLWDLNLTVLAVECDETLTNG
jgi:hypothetical protein